MNESGRKKAGKSFPAFFAVLKEELSGLLDVFLPCACCLCGSPLPDSSHPRLCLACMEQIPWIKGPRCLCCALPFTDFGGEDHVCGACLQSPPPFHRVTTLGIYDGLMRQAIHQFKYNGNIHLATAFGHLLADALTTEEPSSRFDLLVPVPLHRNRLRSRTYNQSLLVAQALASRWKIPIHSRLLRRQLPTKPQQGLSLSERLRNLSGAFASSFPLQGEDVLLIDDVMTTGATVSECTSALLAAGAGRVEIAVLARARRTG